MNNLQNHLENLESAELIHKLKNNYFQSEACEVAIKILHDRGELIPEININLENSNSFDTYSGETEDEKKKRIHRQLSFIYSFAAPILIAGIAWGLFFAIFNLKLNTWISVIFYICDLLVMIFLLLKVQEFITKYDNNDFIIYPSLLVLGPTTLYLLLQILFPFFQLLKIV